MTTRAIMKAEILDDMDRSSTADGTRVLAAISAAIKFYQPKRFYFNESRSVTFNTAADVSTYLFSDIGTEMYRIDGAFLTDGDDVFEMDRRDYLELESLITSDPSTNRPDTYAYIAQGVRTYPVPDDTYSVRLVGHVKVAEPTQDSDANTWFAEAYDLILSRAEAYLFARAFYQPERAAVMRQVETEAFNTLRAATFDRTDTGTVMPTQF